jgi:hypothetical protein
MPTQCGSGCARGSFVQVKHGLGDCPIPVRGPSGWLWRQPGWLLALLFGMLFYLATIGGIQLGDLVYNHGSLQGSGLVLLATFPALLAIGQAARWSVRRERQLGSPAGTPAADVACGSHASLDPDFWRER